MYWRKSGTAFVRCMLSAAGAARQGTGCQSFIGTVCFLQVVCCVGFIFVI
ncbi:hypothetical protein QVN96_13925 [Mediterraneibacter glycyrrhizinilyticus]|nr:hypothetical protein [Mediterraneibacter glycyrrhizinilyticus]MDN0062480.1 hypothetical protein [Mediterraneibacter glycyrrhizinilyticus]